MRVIMNVLAIAICQGVIRLDFSKNLHGKLPFLCPKTIKRQNLAPIVRRNGMQRVSPNKKQNDDVVIYKVINKRKYKGNEENVSGN